MPSMPPSVPLDGPEDEWLLDAVRAGDVDAFQVLYDRYSEPALRLATILVGPDRADDLVSEAFARTLDQLRRGAGPRARFRSYLHSTIRNRHRDLLRTEREDAASDQPWLLDEQEPSAEELAQGIDDNGAIDALTSLPDSWQRVLWYVEVEGLKPAEVATLLGTNAAAASSLVYRAREGLKRAYLDQLVTVVPADHGCRWTRSRLSQYVREDLSSRTRQKVEKHLATCDACSRALAGATEVNRRFAALVLPVVLAGALGQLGPVGGTVTAATSTTVGPRGMRPRPKPRRLARELTARAAGQSPAQAAAGAGAATMSVGVLAGVAVVGTAAAAAVAVTAFSLASADADDDRGPGARPGAGSTSAAADPTTSSADDRANEEATSSAGPQRPIAERPVPPLSSATVATTPSVPAPSPTLPSDRTTQQPIPPPQPPTEEPPLPPTDPPTQPPDPVAVHPVAPVAAPISECGTYGTLTLPTTKGVRYELVSGDGRQGPWVVRATARDGYVLADGATRRFSGDLGTFEPCPTEVRPEAPVAVPITECGTYGTLTLPTTEGVRYELTAGDGREGPWEVTATALDGYLIPDDAQRTFSGDLGTHEPCPVEVRPEPPVAVPITECGTYGTLTLPTTEGIRYELTAGDGREGPWEVTATALDGYLIPDDAQRTFNGDLGTHEPCPVEVRPEAPVSVPITECGTYGTLTLPTTEGIRYERVLGNGVEGPWRVDAVALEGFVIPDDAQRTFSGDLGTYYPCPAVQVAASPLGHPVDDPWRVAVDAVVGGPATHEVEVDYVFSTRVLIDAKHGAGWTCTGPAGEIGDSGSPFVYLAGTTFTCRFDYTGSAPAPLALDVWSIDDSSVIVDPAGTVSMRVDGAPVDSASFAP